MFKGILITLILFALLWGTGYVTPTDKAVAFVHSMQQK
jgi:hypothetical protein